MITYIHSYGPSCHDNLQCVHDDPTSPPVEERKDMKCTRVHSREQGEGRREGGTHRSISLP